MLHSCRMVAQVVGLGLLACCTSRAADLEVGPGRPHDRIEKAVAAAQPGDRIRVFPPTEGEPYEGVALRITTPRLTIEAVPAQPLQRIRLSGRGFDYSGRGSVPRAIVQFDPGADDCVLDGFELTDAHNESHNGAGVRINQANRVTVRNCDIHHNDMGVMSGGGDTLESAQEQIIAFCHIHHNGAAEDPGYNHNLYLGGSSVLVSGCEIDHSLTGHNLKSRAHLIWVEYCWIHDAANRELDLVDAAVTALPGSDAVLVGNAIVKDPACAGNRTVIHFGQDGGKGRDGTIHLVHNTIVTPFIAPVVELSTEATRARFFGNVVWDGGVKQANQTLVALRPAGGEGRVGGAGNWIDDHFELASWKAVAARASGTQPALDDMFSGQTPAELHPAQLLPTGIDLKAVVPPAGPFTAKEFQPVTRQFARNDRLETRSDAGQPSAGAFGPQGRPHQP